MLHILGFLLAYLHCDLVPIPRMHNIHLRQDRIEALLVRQNKDLFTKLETFFRHGFNLQLLGEYKQLRLRRGLYPSSELTVDCSTQLFGLQKTGVFVLTLHRVELVC